MNKCQDKFCPDCGHHLYGPHPVMGYCCAECPEGGQWIDEQDALIIAPPTTPAPDGQQ